VLAHTAAHVRVRVAAALSASTLLCAGAISGHAPGTRATPVVIELARVGAGYRITAQRRA